MSRLKNWLTTKEPVCRYWLLIMAAFILNNAIGNLYGLWEDRQERRHLEELFANCAALKQPACEIQPGITVEVKP